MKTLIISMALWCLTCVAQGQEQIKFAEFESWEAALSHAKSANRPIFIDFFTTWCAPCKQMDAEVYTNSDVANFFNQHFVSVKIQMDQTKKDSKQVQKWYEEAKKLEAKFGITSYPTLLFVKPDGEILNRVIGFKPAAEFLNIGKETTLPNRRYNDKYSVFYQALKEYQKKNNSEDSRLPKLISLARDAKEYLWIDSLTKVYLVYLRKQDIGILRTKQVLEIIGDQSYSITSKDPLFKLFIGNEQQVDQIVGKKGFARLVVDKAIKQEYFAQKLSMKGMMFNQDSLFRAISQKYGKEYADRAILAANVTIYAAKGENELFTKYFIKMIEEYGMTSSLIYSNLGSVKYREFNHASDILVNTFCMEILFRKSSQKMDLLKGVAWMKQITNRAIANKDIGWASLCFDTYANLLYKTGSVQDAIEAEDKALGFLKEIKASKSYLDSYEARLSKMRQGLPTW